VPTQTNITTFATPGDPGYRSAVNDCCVFAQDGAPEGKAQDQREVGTEGKAIIMAGEDGILRIFDISIPLICFLFIYLFIYLFLIVSRSKKRNCHIRSTATRCARSECVQLLHERTSRWYENCGRWHGIWAYRCVGLAYS